MFPTAAPQIFTAGVISPATVGRPRMTSESHGSPYQWRLDIESSGCSRGRDCDDDEISSDVLYIPNTKNASMERLKRWRVAKDVSFELLVAPGEYAVGMLFLPELRREESVIVVTKGLGRVNQCCCCTSSFWRYI